MGLEQSEALRQALAGMEAAEVPLLLPDLSQYTTVTTDPLHGREGLLSRELFNATHYMLDGADNTFWTLQRKWHDDLHVRGVMRDVLGSHADSAGSVLYESTLLAEQRQASVAFVAARLLLDPYSPHQVVFAVWDDGRQYDSEGELHAAFSKDSIWDLTSHPPRPVGYDMEGSVPTTLIRSVTEEFRGRLTVMSGRNRLDVTHNDDDGHIFRTSSFPEVAGTVLVARLARSE